MSSRSAHPNGVHGCRNSGSSRVLSESAREAVSLGSENRPAFREAFQRLRCIVAVDNFYEWKKTSDKQQMGLRRLGTKSSQTLPVEGGGFELSVPREIGSGIETSSELGPIDPSVPRIIRAVVKTDRAVAAARWAGPAAARPQSKLHRGGRQRATLEGGEIR